MSESVIFRSHVCVVRVGVWVPHRAVHLQQIHVKTSDQVWISPYEMRISSPIWMSLLARRATPLISRHSVLVPDRIRPWLSISITIGNISAFTHELQQECWAYCPSPVLGGEVVRRVLS